ncbi:MAG: type II toxin-antitoxin system YafQ family toxin [Bacteroidales bacterium]|nr:type II toxin-antitoxin system YafQ family toxin [Bacteroidales bacterium]
MKKYSIRYTGVFKKKMRLCEKRGYDMSLIKTVIGMLSIGERLPERYHAHLLTGERKGQWECHIQPDWLLIWEIRDNELVLVLIDTGTHSELFDKKYKK